VATYRVTAVIRRLEDQVADPEIDHGVKAFTAIRAVGSAHARSAP
jgi:hypothetical protein